jgi:hypothetical protein
VPSEVDLGYSPFFDHLYWAGMGLPRLEGFPDRTGWITGHR